MTLNNKRIEYVFFNSINELVQRLVLLIWEKQAGHTGHDNEILSILEELQELKVIKKPCKEKLLLV